jgi:hypothetical protein
VNSRKNHKYNPYAKFLSTPSKVIPTDTTSNKFKSNSEILVTKIVAKCEYPIQNQETMQKKLEDKENMKSKIHQSALKASELVH